MIVKNSCHLLKLSELQGKKENLYSGFCLQIVMAVMINKAYRDSLVIF
jgi:hypothetical protein